VAPLDIAHEVAEETRLPVMAHLDNPPPSRLEVLARLRRGDILTHCFRPFPNAPVTGDGQIREEVPEARRRGVIFDIGHGSGSFGFRTAEGMLTAGFLPDVISSDVHLLSINGPAFDQLVTMSKFLCLGMELIDVIRASTAAPAAALGRTDIGRLEIGAVGDATVLDLAEANSSTAMFWARCAQALAALPEEIRRAIREEVRRDLADTGGPVKAEAEYRIASGRR